MIIHVAKATNATTIDVSNLVTQMKTVFLVNIVIGMAIIARQIAIQNPIVEMVNFALRMDLVSPDVKVIFIVLATQNVTKISV